MQESQTVQLAMSLQFATLVIMTLLPRHVDESPSGQEFRHLFDRLLHETYDSGRWPGGERSPLSGTLFEFAFVQPFQALRYDEYLLRSRHELYRLLQEHTDPMENIERF